MQLSFTENIIRGTSFSENEQQFVIRNLSMKNKEIAERLGRTESSISNFLYKNQIQRTKDQLEQIRARLGEAQRGDQNPNFKNWSSKNTYRYKLRSIARYPIRHNAREQVHQAVKRGSIIPKDYCERCGSTEKIEAHHAFYSKPLEVEWLCRGCHVEADKERRLIELKAEAEGKEVIK